MGIVNMDDVRGIWADRGTGDKVILCQECATDEEWNNALEEDLITSQAIEADPDKMYFCDECHKQL
jgi:Zn-finger nucleic acid-binding protein